jgi:hypothetical protein
MYVCIVLFLKQMFFSYHLQRPTVQGKVSLTCDAWQASNTDRYFAVTLHWIKGPMTRKWKLNSALIDFMQLNNMHNGVRLGQVLLKILKQVGIKHKISISSLLFDQSLQLTFSLKVSHITYDNASNNLTILKELTA